MKQSRLATAGLAILVAGTLAAGDAIAQDPRFVSMGTGGVTGVYYPVGVAICRLVNQDRREHGIRCSVESTGGSVSNVEAIRAGDLEFGIVQSDVQATGYSGEGAFAQAGPYGDLRAVMSLHAEPLTIVARSDAGIATIDDLAGKRVDIGSPGSGQRALMDRYMAEKGWDPSTFALAAELPPAEVSRALCDSAVDAFVVTVGHPAGLIQDATTACDTVLASAGNAAIEALIARFPYYFRATIPGGMYRGTDADIPTFGVGATLVTRADVPDDMVYTVVKSVLDDFETFRGLHPALADLDPLAMATEGISAPLHPGAERYYSEQGWIQ